MAEQRRTCASCGTANEEDARFCESCGASFARTCETCGVEARASARFCRACGAPLDDQAAQLSDVPVAGPVRKTVTVLFADLAGSTSFEERVDAETAREVIGRYHDLLRMTAHGHRAGVTKYIGDGFMAVWGVPEIGPDDAGHAVDAAVELQERFVALASQVAETHGVELDLRVAVNTGEVVVGAGDADLVGDALNVGARLEAECPRGHVVAGEETWRATRGQFRYESLGQVQVKGRTAPVTAYQWLGRQSSTADAAPFVGRSDEVRRLQATMDDAVTARAARLVTVIGDPGVGKSRLAAEFTGAQSEARVIDARCDPEGTVALAPLVELLRATDLETDIPASVPERDRLLRDLNGLATGIAGSVEENFWALRRFIEVLATDGPVVLVLDDIQWADTLLLDFVEHLVEWASEVPVLVLALARPELRELRPDLVTVSRWVSEAVHLSGLDPRATAELAAKVLGAARLPDELLRRLPSTTGGNPLFVRELIGMLAHDGVLVQELTGWRLTIDVDAIAIPPTIHALLASRLERLDATDRRVLEIASVVGSDFSLGAVRALAGNVAAGVALSLKRLRRLELTQPSGAYVGDEPVWRFHHVLIRDVAYRRLLKSDRADLHERLAEWVATGGPSVAFDSDEMIARHLELAHTYRVELGTLDEHTDDLALRAARHYAASARRALDRDELLSAGAQAARGAALAADDGVVHAELLLIGCEAFLSAGDVAAGAPLVDDLDRIADETLAPWATCYRCQFVIYTDPERLLEVDARLQGAIDEFGRRSDPAGLAKAHRVRAGARSRLGRIGDCEADLFEALIAARHSGDHRQITAALGAAPGAALWGPSPVPKAGGRCLDVVRMQRMTTAAPSLEATSLRCLAVLELLRGRPDKARTMLAEARQVVADLGLRHGLMETELFAGIIESMEGDPVAAEPHFRTALEGLEALGVGADAGQAAALLARSVLAQGRVDEADRHATVSERLAGRNLKTAIAWRAVRAEILAARGQHTEAAAMARDAVAVAAGTDLVIDHADACLALSRVLTAGGNTKGANGARDDAERLYAAKEVAKAIRREAEPAPPPVTAPPGLTAKAPASSRLAVTNQSCEYLPAFLSALHAHDVDGTLNWFSDDFVYDDRRKLSGDPIVGRDAMRAAIERIFMQYTKFDIRVLAVRGQRSHLLWNRWSDDDGNETTTFYVNETGDDGRLTYHARFDEDDFEGAYREFESRYLAGEGVAFADAGATVTKLTLALNRADFDMLFDEITASDFRIENRSRSAFPDRSATEYRATLEELAAMVVSSRGWCSAISWLSPNYGVARCERDAVGEDGEQYTWLFLVVFEARDGLIASMCEFELDDEDGAFAYAEERVRATTSRLGLTNQAARTAEAFWAAMRDHDVDGALECCSEGMVYDDRRSISGDPIHDRATLRAAISRILEQYTDFETRTLAVRGEHLHLGLYRWSNSAGFETTYLDVVETGDHGRFEYDARFDEDDFENAFRELERRYRESEGAEFAEASETATEYMIALNQRNLDRLFGELTSADFCLRNRSRSPFGDRSAAEFRASVENLHAMVAWARSWESAVCWLSPTLDVSRYEREAVGHEGERFAWTHILVNEIRNGRIESACLFDVDDEEGAFAYAEERVQASVSRLALTNRASETVTALASAGRARDVDAMFGWYSDGFTYDDRRRISGDPIATAAALRIAQERILEQYSRFDLRTLAVRGERLHLGWGRWSNDAGFETTHLYVHEVGDDGRVVFEGRFDEDDFEGAYRELDRRYYTGEGAAFAEAGATATDWVIGFNRSDFDWIFGELTSPELHFENRSRSVFPDRSAAQFRGSVEELNAMVASSRTWHAVVSWLSPGWVVVRQHRDAVGRDGERYEWLTLHVSEVRGGQLQSICQFEIEDEESAFAYAEERVRATTSRLAVANRASTTTDALGLASRTADVDGAVSCYANRCVFDDRRRLSGDPISGAAALRAATQRIFEQYSQFDWRTLAVRGTCLHLASSRWADDAGNETGYLHLREVDDDGRFTYDARFDADDFNAAYRELERRYYAGEGAAFAEPGALVTAYIIAYNDGDFDKLFGDLTTPGIQFENRSRSVFPDRSVDEFRASVEELSSMVSSSRTWSSAICWMSASCCVSRLEREAIGQEGERYSWTTIYVNEGRNGQVAAVCQFDLEDEEAAFAYAEERIRAANSRLAVTNRSCGLVVALTKAMQAHDVDDIMRCMSERLVYDDRRRLTGDPISGEAEFRAAFARILEQYNHFENRIVAVRGERLNLNWSRWSDAAGNETSYLHVFEIGDDGRQIYEGRFDEEDFEGAYRELDRRYYSGEGASFADAGTTVTEYVIALNRGEFDRVFGELSSPEFRLENRSRSGFGDRSTAELRASYEELTAMVASARIWHSTICWLSRTVALGRFERNAVGQDGERYAWTLIDVAEIRDGRIELACQFELDDEDAAVSYAEERMRASASRLAVTNRSCESVHAMANALRANDIDAAFVHLSEGYEYDDRRRLSGDPIHGLAELRVAVERILAQYNRFEWRTLAVRGQRISLSSSRWSDDAGNETTHLHVFEIGEDGLIAYEGRFDEDDFASAYRELDRRYYAGEGAAFAEAGSLATEYAIAMFNGDYDKLFGDLSHPDMRVENRTRSGFPDRSLAELRSSIEDLDAMVASARTWHSAVVWVSPTCCIGRHEREAVGHDGERFTWTRVLVFEVRGGRMASMCAFELEYEEAAFAYAEERVQATTSRLPMTNRATEVGYRTLAATEDRDIDAVVAAYSDEFTYDDRRRLSGDPVTTRAELRAAAERIRQQYSRFEAQTLAVRGERLQLARTRWSDDAGNETTYLQVIELGGDGRVDYHVAFDEDDFVDAYRELEDRFFAGEGAAFAEAGAITTDYMIAANRGDLDLLFGDLTAPGVYFENRSRSGFPDRSASEYQVGTTDLFATMDSVRLWNTATCWLSPTVIIGRQVREARGAEGELYAWDRLLVSEVLNGRIASACEFELEHEDAAFAYAEEQVRATAGRLAVVNLASRVWNAVGRAMRAHNADGAAALFADSFVYDDRWAVGGDPPDEVRTAVERIFEQYSQFEGQTLAVRGDTLQLARSRWSNDAGYETTYLHVTEIDGDGRISYYGRFDEDDFEGAYCELDQRYYAGEGAAFAEAGTALTEWMTALNRGDLDHVFAELTDPDMRFEIRSSSAFPDRTAAELRASLEELNTWVASTQAWHSAMRWLSPNCCVSRNERTAVGRDGEQYAWTRLYVFEVRDGRGVASCEFEVDDEEAAFAYAEERMQATASRLAVSNRASRTTEAILSALQTRDVDGAVACYIEKPAYDDRRRLAGNPLPDIRAANERVLEQYTEFEGRTLAVRGERLALAWTRWSNAAGFETAYLVLNEVGDDGRIAYQARFDEDDFGSAYRELARRYCAGEGAAVAGGVAAGAEWLIAVNRGDFDRAFGELTDPDMPIENRSSSPFPHVSAAELRTSFEELYAMFASVRSWNAAERWLSPTCCVCRNEREAAGQDGGRYTWTRIFVVESRDGRPTGMCEFEFNDEDAAFAYAEERVRGAEDR